MIHGWITAGSKYELLLLEKDPGESDDQGFSRALRGQEGEIPLPDRGGTPLAKREFGLLPVSRRQKGGPVDSGQTEILPTHQVGQHLIDGNYRAVRAKREGRLFEEVKEILGFPPTIFLSRFPPHFVPRLPSLALLAPLLISSPKKPFTHRTTLSKVHPHEKTRILHSRGKCKRKIIFALAPGTLPNINKRREL